MRQRVGEGGTAEAADLIAGLVVEEASCGG
jgi:hypothetical protein